MRGDAHQDGTAALYVADALSADERDTFERHLADCAHCRREVQDLREAAALLSQSEATTPPPGLRSAILAQIAETAQETADTGTPSAHRDEADGADGATVRGRPRHAVRPRGWRRIPYLVAAVAVLVALGGGVWGWRAHNAAVTAEQQNQLITHVLGSPDSVSRSARMTGGGRGVVIVSQDNHQAIFVGSDLPRPASDQVYQLWTIKGQPTSAGLIDSHRSTVVVRLPSAAVQASSVAVTVEPAGGSPVPTHKPVMTFQLS